jgi:hypothetical protein
MVPEHVHHGNAADDSAKQVRPLHHDGAGEQAAIAAPFDREAAGVRVAFRHQPFGRRDEIVEHILLPLEHAGLVPRLSVLSSAAQIRDGVDAPPLE